jgi:hypothetical protein
LDRETEPRTGSKPKKVIHMEPRTGFLLPVATPQALGSPIKHQDPFYPPRVLSSTAGAVIVLERISYNYPFNFFLEPSSASKIVLEFSKTDFYIRCFWSAGAF